MKKFLRRCTLLAFCLLLVELVLQLACWKNPSVNSFFEPRARPTDVSANLSDPHLITRPNPEYPGHDSRGWRNIGAQENFDIVALGNSQTYGRGTALQHAWPQQLEFLTGQSVYNLSWGGYAVLDHVCLLDEALALKPHTFLVAFYTPDIYGCYHRVYTKGILRRFREGRTDPLRFMMDLGLIPSVAERVEQILEIDRRAQRAAADLASTTADVPYQKPPRRPGRIPVPYNSRHLKLLRVFPASNQYLLEHWRSYYRLHYRLTGHVNELLPDESFGEKRQPYKEVPVVGTPFAEQISASFRFYRSFQVKRRSEALNLLDPRVAEGYRICEEAFAEIKQRAEAQGIRVIAVFIPTKELAFRNFLEERCTVSFPSDYLIQNARERLVRSMLHHFLVSIDVEVIDVLPALEACLDRDVLPYPWDNDGHPNKIGYNAIARLVQQKLDAPRESNLALPTYNRDELVARAYPDAQPAGPVDTQPDRLRVVAQLETLHPLPTIQSTLPYTRAMTVQIYTVLERIEGEEQSERIAVASWAILDGKPLKREWSLEHPVELDVLLLDQQTDLKQERIEDHTDEYELPVYYDPHSLPENAEI